ncbi:MAG: Clp protease ClpC [Candidatus Yanofskybacteria bacterium RIFCSPHIGHO2_02_FULL_43_15c]|uniref:Clp protease ClpC n=2 Tax=Candidatus Yanofskyibacteriota TaxID=1752733 RepID=A0A1F8H4Z5_9BACT|nr:MAG: Clp protease ClpC [Candidatus Yanofskybacteria bacterium RIFCSPHIGHO2_02_FULL_43_15c]OGN32651.1 MAG: Clp protease ClpC [Candidatus Yanofskybacteria bacterium RIFCSPLOWO2_02_FULL_43_10b]
MNNLCDICKKNPAAGKMTVIKNGVRQTKNICQSCANKTQGRSSGGFGGRGFGDLNDIFGGLLGDIFGQGGGGGQAGGLEGFGLPGTMRAPSEERVDFTDYLSDEANQVLDRAAEFAQDNRHAVIDTEHLLFSLLQNEIATNLLKHLKIDVKSLEKEIKENMAKGANVPQELEYSPRLKRVFDLSLDEARALNHNYIGPEHLMLALVKEGEGLASQLLKRFGLADAGPLRQTVIKKVGMGKAESVIKMNTPTLDKFSRDLSQLAREGKLDPVIGRSKEIETAIEILSRRTKNNPVLIGEPGVGKTAIVEGLAQRIVAGSVPESLFGKRLVEIDLAAIMSGTRFRGDLEERLKMMIDEIKANRDNLIVFIDEVHLLVGTGSAGESGMDAANIFKPSLARGELHVVGATTLKEYKKYIEKDQALERRFQPIIVPEPSVEQAIEILRGLRDRYESHHRIKILDEALVAAAELSNRYVSSRFLPDKAIDLMDQAAARVRIQSTSEPPEVRELDEQIHSLKKELEAAQRAKKVKEAEKNKKEIGELEKKREQLFDQWQGTMARSIPVVNAQAIAEVVSKLTGIPVSELTEEEREKLLNLEKKLAMRVIGQDEAIKAVASAIRRSRAGLGDPYRPIASFIFLGPTGVGKTELSRSLSHVLFGDQEAMVRLDMSEYMERHNVARLIGAPPGYVGFEEGGQLTEAVRRRPHSIVLLDEIEKAHPDVFNVLLQILEDGRLTDGQGRAVDFTNTVIIATSNVGSELIQHEMDKEEKKRMEYEELRVKLKDELKKYFRPEFLNRLDEIIVFHGLGKEQLIEIVKLQLGLLRSRLNKVGLDLKISEEAITQLAEEGYDPHFGARELRRLIQREIENRISDEILRNKLARGTTIKVDFGSASGGKNKEFTLSLK